MSKPADRRDAPAFERETTRIERPAADPGAESGVSGASDTGSRRVSSSLSPRAEKAAPAPGSDEVAAGVAAKIIAQEAEPTTAKTVALAATSTAVSVTALTAPAENLGSTTPFDLAKTLLSAGADGDTSSTSAPKTGEQAVVAVDVPLQINLRADPAILLFGEQTGGPDETPVDTSVATPSTTPALPSAEAAALAFTPEGTSQPAASPLAAGEKPAAIVPPLPLAEQLGMPVPPPPTLSVDGKAIAVAAPSLPAAGQQTTLAPDAPTTTGAAPQPVLTQAAGTTAATATPDEELDLEASAETNLPGVEAGLDMAALPSSEMPIQTLLDAAATAPTLIIDTTVVIDPALALAVPAAAAPATIEPTTPTQNLDAPVISRPAAGAPPAPFVATEIAAQVDGTASPTATSPEKPTGRPDPNALSTFGEQFTAATGDTSRIDTAGQQARLDQAAPASSQPSPTLSGFGLLQPTGGLQAAVAASHAGPAHPIVSGVPIQAVPVEIGLKSLAGINRFDIRLAPDDLGEIEVRLDISEGGEVRAHIVVERPDAFHSLQRETSQLERALEQAGLKTGDEGVSVSLRQQGQGEAGNRRGDERDGQAQTGARAKDNSETQAVPAPAAQRYAWTRASGVDRHI